MIYSKYSDQLKQEIIEFCKSNSLSKASKQFDIGVSTIRYWINPEYRKKQIIDSNNYYHKNYNKHKKYKQHYYSIEENRIKKNNINKNRYNEILKFDLDFKQKKSQETIQWHKNNPLKSKQQRKKYFNKRYKNDIEFNILKRCRLRIRAALNGSYKYNNTIDLLGCSPKELKLHIESRFLNGMTWKNRDKWHIDHIKPCCGFDLTNPEQQKECFHYTNLQPLWAKDNRKKGVSF